MYLKGIVQYFVEYAYLLSCQELDEETDTTAMFVQ